MPFQTHSIGGSTVGYALIQVLSAGGYRFTARYLIICTMHNTLRRYTGKRLIQLYSAILYIWLSLTMAPDYLIIGRNGLL